MVVGLISATDGVIVSAGTSVSAGVIVLAVAFVSAGVIVSAGASVSTGVVVSAGAFVWSSSPPSPPEVAEGVLATIEGGEVDAPVVGGGLNGGKLLRELLLQSSAMQQLL